MKKQPRPLWTYFPAAALLWLIFGFFRLLPLDFASALGGRIAQRVSPLLHWNYVVKQNLAFIFPEWSTEKREEIRQEMWDNLGRVMAEYAWLSTPKMAERIEISEASRVLFAEIKQSGSPVIFAGGHFANWEIIPLSMYLYGNPATLIYRRANNPLVEKLIHRIRMGYCGNHFPKGTRGASGAIRALKAGEPLGMLVDQKMNNGIELPFLGKPAMTASGVVEMALRYDARIIAIRVLRLKGVRFRVDLAEITLPDATMPDATMQVMLQIHAHLEGWLREAPAQWLWVHQRWGKWKGDVLVR